MQITSGLNTGNWLSGGVHCLIIAAAAQFDSPAVWPYALLAMSGVSFAAWIGNYRRLRRIADTPLSNIATAAQGYVEIAGRADPDNSSLLSHLTQAPCLWFQFEVHEKSGDDNWTLRESGTSDTSFAIRDNTGTCVIDPRGAEVVTSHEQTWTSGSYRYVERLLLPQERIYGLGEFATLGGPGSTFDNQADVGNLLAAWKRDPATLLSRFDLDKNGSIDLQEWELARRQARREVEAKHREAQSIAGTNTLRKPRDGRPYLLSNYLPERLQSNYLRWAWGHAIICIGASGVAVALF